MASSALLLLTLSALLPLCASSPAWAGPKAISRFKTEPDFRPLIFKVSHMTDDRSKLGPGYYFLSPFMLPGYGWGPQIYDDHGHLVWNGNKTASNLVHGFYMCDYLGTKDEHLCWHELNARGGFNGNRVFDNNYQPISDYTNTGKLVSMADAHEFNILPGGDTFLIPVWKKTQMDLTPYNGEPDGWIREACFQEVNMTDDTIVYSWCATGRFNLWETYIYPHTPNQINFTTLISGVATHRSPWDYVHLNAIDKNEEGDYFVSARHCNSIVKVAGPNNRHGLAPGTIMWRLGGKLSNFKMPGWVFSRQHHVRWHSTTEDEEVITLFDNAWEGMSQHPTQPQSSGKIITVNNRTMTARLDRQYLNPLNGLAGSRGSMQILPNKNAVIGWGALAQISEFSENGTVLFHASWASPDCVDGFCPGNSPEIDYRTLKYEWVGKPIWDPKIVAYALKCPPNAKAPLTAYVSWNGATEVREWRFYTRTSPNASWYEAGTFPRHGFETMVKLLESPTNRTLSRFMPYVKVEALDVNREVLGSADTKTFVPKAGIVRSCDAAGCFEPDYFDYPERLNAADQCVVGERGGHIAAIATATEQATGTSWTLPIAVGALVAGAGYVIFRTLRPQASSSKGYQPLMRHEI